MILTGEWTLSHAERMDQMQQAVNRQLPFLKRGGRFSNGKMSIACYGPSLKETWETIPRPIIAVSGAYDFLLERGITPEFYVSIDPRESAVELLKNPQKETVYLMASVCHPRWWDHLAGFDVKLWHLVDGLKTVEWVREHHPAGMQCLIGGGSTVGQRAMNVGASLGYRRFDIFGMDCSFTEDRHAGPHNAERQPIIKTQVGDRIFHTSPQFWQAAREMAEFITTVDAEVEFHGDGLLQAIAKNIHIKR